MDSLNVKCFDDAKHCHTVFTSSLEKYYEKPM
jgi:hypothetical protein